MKLTTVLVLGAAATAAYLAVTKRGQQNRDGEQAQTSEGQAGRSGPARLAQTVKDRVSGRRGGGTGSSGQAPAATTSQEGGSAANDLALARQVEATLALNPHFTKGRVLVNADNGRVTLRGTTDVGEHITSFEETARAVPGVMDVQNLLHIQGTAAPSAHRGGLARDAVDRVFSPAES
jgi:osmotically-inducible protein OsmY